MEFSPESCPLCGTALSKTKFVEIQSKLRQEDESHRVEERRKIAKIEHELRSSFDQELQKKLSAERATVEAVAKKESAAELKQKDAELEAVRKKLSEASTREKEILAKSQTEKEAAAKAAKKELEEEIRKIAAARDASELKLGQVTKERAALVSKFEADKKEILKAAQKESEEKLNRIAAERDAATVKLKDVEVRVLKAREQAVQEANKEHQKKLESQRTALETDKTTAILKQQADFSREKEALQKKVKQMEHQLQKKTANEIGDGAEVDLYEALREAFRDDHITRVQKGAAGADIIWEIMHKGQCCGRIVLDSKNRQIWKYEYVSKLRQDQTEAKADHAILASSQFPAGRKELCIESGVIIVNPARAVHIGELLRNSVVTMHIRGLSNIERSGKMERLYKLINSETYSCKFQEAGNLTQDILELDVQEKKTHDNVWKKRGSLATRLSNVLRDIDTDVASVIEANDEPDSVPRIDVARAAAAPNELARAK